MFAFACFFVALACAVYICNALPALGRFVGYSLLAIVGVVLGIAAGAIVQQTLVMLVAPLACAYLLPMSVWYAKRHAAH